MLRDHLGFVGAVPSTLGVNTYFGFRAGVCLNYVDFILYLN